MNIFSQHKRILLGIIVLTIAFFGYWYFVLSKKSTTTGTSKTGALIKNVQSEITANAPEKTYDKEFVSGLLSLNNINLDITMFNSAAYKALSFPDKPFAVDYDIPSGRQNPFLPIGVSTGKNIFTTPINTVPSASASPSAQNSIQTGAGAEANKSATSNTNTNPASESTGASNKSPIATSSKR